MTRPGTAEPGRTDDGAAVHAVRPGLAGPTALCGAGKVVQRLPGRFDPAADDACPACVAQSG